MTPNEATPSSLLRVRDLRVSFGAVEVLHGVDLDVRPGVIHALIGESGSGKSVLARSILGLAGRKSRTTGSIRFENRELVGLTEKEYRAIRGAEIGMVVQASKPSASATPTTAPAARRMKRTCATSRSRTSKRSGSRPPKSAWTPMPISSRAACVSAS